MRESTDNIRIKATKSPLLRLTPDIFYKWKNEFLKNCRLGRKIKIKWIKNPYQTSTFSGDVLNGQDSTNKSYTISGITDRLLILEDYNGVSTSLSFKDIYMKDNIIRYDWVGGDTFGD